MNKATWTTRRAIAATVMEIKIDVEAPVAVARPLAISKTDSTTCMNAKRTATASHPLRPRRRNTGCRKPSKPRNPKAMDGQGGRRVMEDVSGIENQNRSFKK